MKAILLLYASLFILACTPKGPHMPLAETGKLSNKPGGQNSTTPGGGAGTDQPSTPIDCQDTKYTVGFLEDVRPIFQTYCSQCHGFNPMNWLDYNIAKTKLSAFDNRLFIRKDMPMVGYARPTDDEYSIIRLWIDSGGPERREVPARCENKTQPEPPSLEPQPPSEPETPVSPPVDSDPPFEPPPEDNPPPTSPEGIGFEEDILPLFKTYCGQCHFYGNLNWLSYEAVKLKLPQIEDRMFVKKDMPMGEVKPSPQEYDLIKRWLELGGPKNR